MKNFLRTMIAVLAIASMLVSNRVVVCAGSGYNIASKNMGTTLLRGESGFNNLTGFGRLTTNENVDAIIMGTAYCDHEGYYYPEYYSTSFSEGCLGECSKTIDLPICRNTVKFDACCIDGDYSFTVTAN